MFHRCTIPISLPALINRIDYPVKGYYPEELNTEIIRKAVIAIIDIHWNYALNGAFHLVWQLKKINKNIIVIAGGMTASMFPEQLIQKHDIDYVVRGDGEIPLPFLVKSMMEKDDISLVPNIYAKNGLITEWTYFLNSEDLDKNDYYDLSFFPSYKNDIKNFHKRYFGWPNYTFPYLLPFRGCPMPCSGCAGGIQEQKRLFRRGYVSRSAGKLAEDLNLLNNDKDIRYVNVIHDFVSLMNEDYVQTVLNKPTQLSLLYEFTKSPSKERLELLLSRFKGGVLYFSLDKMHTQSSQLNDIATLIDLINLTKGKSNFIPVLYYNKHFILEKGYDDAIKTIVRHTKCLASDVSGWWEDFPRPDENGTSDESSFQKFFNLSAKPKLSLVTKINRKVIWFSYLLITKILHKSILLKIKLIYMKTFQPYHT